MTALRISEFPIDEIPSSCSWIVIGPPGSGKTNWIEWLMYVHRSEYPVAKVFNGSEGMNHKFEKFVPKINITDKYVEDEAKRYMLRQKRVAVNRCNDGKAIIVIDDCSDDRKIYTSPPYQHLYKVLSRHGNNIIITGLQYGVDFPPGVRKSGGWVALGYEADDNERRKLYDNFGGLCGTYHNFCQIMDQMIVTTDENGNPKPKAKQDKTDKHIFLIIKRLDPSSNIEENIFYSKAPDMKDIRWKFGCDEAWKWDKDRRDSAKGYDFDTF